MKQASTSRSFLGYNMKRSCITKFRGKMTKHAKTAAMKHIRIYEECLEHLKALLAIALGALVLLQQACLQALRLVHSARQCIVMHSSLWKRHISQTHVLDFFLCSFVKFFNLRYKNIMQKSCTCRTTYMTILLSQDTRISLPSADFTATGETCQGG